MNDKPTELRSAIDGRILNPMVDPMPNEDCAGTLTEELADWVADHELLVCTWLGAQALDVDDAGAVWAEAYRGGARHGKWLTAAETEQLADRINHYIDPT